MDFNYTENQKDLILALSNSIKNFDDNYWLNEYNIDIIKQAKNYLKKYSLKDVVELISKKEKISKNKIYEICLKIKKNEKET